MAVVEVDVDLQGVLVVAFGFGPLALFLGHPAQLVQGCGADVLRVCLPTWMVRASMRASYVLVRAAGGVIALQHELGLGHAVHHDHEVCIQRPAEEAGLLVARLRVQDAAREGQAGGVVGRGAQQQVQRIEDVVEALHLLQRELQRVQQVLVFETDVDLRGRCVRRPAWTRSSGPARRRCRRSGGRRRPPPPRAARPRPAALQPRAQEVGEDGLQAHDSRRRRTARAAATAPSAWRPPAPRPSASKGSAASAGSACSCSRVLRQPVAVEHAGEGGQTEQQRLRVRRQVAVGVVDAFEDAVGLLRRLRLVVQVHVRGLQALDHLARACRWARLASTTSMARG